MVSQDKDQLAAARVWFGFLFGVLLLIAASLTIVGVAATRGGTTTVSAEPPVIAEMSLVEF